MQPLRLRLLPFAVLFVVPTVLKAQVYERVDVDNQGQPGNVQAVPSGDISDDGRFVVFVSAATSFGGPDIAGTDDVFLRDRHLGTTSRVSSTTVPGDADAITGKNPRMSGDGFVLAFMRGGVSSTPLRAFVYQRATGVITQVVVPNLQNVRIDDLNRDGTYAAIVARTTTDPTQQVYRLHLPTGDLVLCSRDSSGNPVGGLFGSAAIDDEGTHVAFVSASSQLVPGDTNAARDAFVFDVRGGLMLRASVGQDGVQGNMSTDGAAISGDGRFVAMNSLASNLVAADSNTVTDIFVRDLRLGVTSLASLTTAQLPFIRGSFSAFISGDGTTVAFSSQEQAPPLDTDLTSDPFVRDLDVGVLLPAGVPSSYPPEAVWPLGLTRDGRELLIGTTSITPPTDSPLKGVYVAKFGPRCSSSGYCTSLPNSTGDAASIGAQGDASRQLNNLVIAGLGLPEAAISMLVSGTSAIDPGTPFGNGLLCVGGALIRHGVHVANGGVILDAQDMSAPEYSGVQPGDTRFYQVFYRDPPAGGALFNTTDAVAITFCW